MSRHAIISLTTKHGPMTAKQIALELGIGESSVRTSIRRARAYGTRYLRIAGWAQDVPKYGPGPGDDVAGGSTADHILERLQDGGPATVAQLTLELGTTTGTIDSAVRRLRRKGGVIRIVGYKLHRGSGGREAAIFAFGPGRDAKRPDFSNAQREAERRYAEKRRIQSVLNGGRTRGSRKRVAALAGPFDGLLRP